MPRIPVYIPINLRRDQELLDTTGVNGLIEFHCRMSNTLCISTCAMTNIHYSYFVTLPPTQLLRPTC